MVVVIVLCAAVTCSRGTVLSPSLPASETVLALSLLQQGGVPRIGAAVVVASSTSSGASCFCTEAVLLLAPSAPDAEPLSLLQHGGVEGRRALGATVVVASNTSRFCAEAVLPLLPSAPDAEPLSLLQHGGVEGRRALSVRLGATVVVASNTS